MQSAQVPDVPLTPRAEIRPVPAAECPICKGAGFLRVDADLSSPMFGRAIPCECRLNDQDEQAFSDLQKFSNLDPFKSLTFANFDPTVQGLERAYTLARRYAAEPEGWLVFMGGMGVGKTHLAAAIANQAINQKFRVLFMIVPDLLDHLRSSFAPTSAKSYDELFDAIRSCPLLVLDDLGTESTTPWAQEKLYQLINHRYNYRLPTVITTNRPLDRLDDRISSRMQDKAMVEIVRVDAADYRKLDRGERKDARSIAERQKQNWRR